MITATVSAPVATLWRRPDAPRPSIDAAALAAQSDPQAWASGLDDVGRYYDGVLTQLLQGEPVLIEEISDGWARVVATAQPAAKLDPRGYPGWLPVEQLRFDDVLEVARGWIGTRYVWGGLTSHGIDCSGLVHLAFRRVGRTMPRDADDQARATTPVAAGEERVGDLYFFSAKPQKVTHVGFVTGPDQILHACGDKGFVVEEPMPQERRETLVGIHRVD
ncbi:hypothetical protein Rhe02_31190 [Rhizocola hellebori]|uniref:NlpC/P60 domain-containing protein n=1 Tax=Rhizocola hellebori TaxID=1392758 RepID=A0A8J3VGE2_9ACTN|nr:NlpC/P60 family protein [Rhizocola hellebori]GIH05052.1 hypothetical protein Rhe02_31190 [Rhizocola hellebori]